MGALYFIYLHSIGLEVNANHNRCFPSTFVLTNLPHHHTCRSVDQNVCHKFLSDSTSQ